MGTGAEEGSGVVAPGAPLSDPTLCPWAPRRICNPLGCWRGTEMRRNGRPVDPFSGPFSSPVPDGTRAHCAPSGVRVRVVRLVLGVGSVLGSGKLVVC